MLFNVNWLISERKTPRERRIERLGKLRNIVGDERFQTAAFEQFGIKGRAEALAEGIPFEPSSCDSSNVIPFVIKKKGDGGVVQTEITIWFNSEDVLSKTLKLGKDGKLVKTPEADLWRGHARRVPIANLSELAQVILKIGKFESPTLGRLRADLPDKVRVTTKDRLNDSTSAIARSREFVYYEEGCAAIVLLDYDTHDKPAKIVVKDFWKTLLKVCPGLRNAARLIRASTSAGLYNLDTGEDIPGSSGVHIYIHAKDGSDVQRFLRAVFERAWLKGFGWVIIAENGRMLERSIVDHTVWKPEGFAFEAPPILKKPLAQHAERREPVVIEGEVIDTLAACPSLDADERARFDELVAAAKEERAEEAAKVKTAYDGARIADLVGKGVPRENAETQVESMFRGVLNSDTELLFKNPKLKGCTVKDVLDDPERFKGEYLADPAEISLGRQKAIVIRRRRDGWPYIKVFSHGTEDTSYDLAYTEKDRAELDSFKLIGVEQAEAITAELRRERVGDGDGDGDGEYLTKPKPAAEKTSNVVVLKTELFDPWAQYHVPEFPLDVLPNDVVREFVIAEGEVLGCKSSAMAMGTLAAISGAIDHRFKLKMMRHGNWYVSPRIWVLLYGDSSKLKTPLIDAATEPLEAYQAERQQEYRTELQYAEMSEVKCEKPKPPERYVVYDTTIEKLGDMLARSGRGLLVKRDEFAGWVSSMEKYGRGDGANRAFWLKAFDGGPYVVDRIVRGEIFVENNSVSLIGGIQPRRLAELQGLTSDGLLQRFIPHVMQDQDHALDRPCDTQAYSSLIRQFLHMMLPQEFVLSDPALKVMDALRLHLFNLGKATGGMADGFQAFIGKLRGLSGNLTLILHMLTNPGKPKPEVAADTVENVRRLVVDFILPHALEFYHCAESATDGDRLKKIASWILTHGKDRFVVSDITSNVADFRGLTVYEVNERISPLIASGWLSPTGETGNMCRAWKVNLKVFAQFAERAKLEDVRKAEMAKLMHAPRKDRA